MEADDAPFIAIFDADFVPDPTFLKRAMIPLLQEDDLALVQGRWEHLNRGDKAITAAQAVGIDAHFAIEQICPCLVWSGHELQWHLRRLAALGDHCRRWLGTRYPHRRHGSELPRTTGGLALHLPRWLGGSR